MLQTTSTERRAAGGDRPRSGGSVNMRPHQVDFQRLGKTGCSPDHSLGTGWRFDFFGCVRHSLDLRSQHEQDPTNCDFEFLMMVAASIRKGRTLQRTVTLV